MYFTTEKTGMTKNISGLKYFHSSSQHLCDLNSNRSSFIFNLVFFQLLFVFFQIFLFSRLRSNILK